MTCAVKILSVSIAAYNVEAYLREALDSCLAIDSKALDYLEVIVVNDGSKDSTLDIANEFAANYPDVVKVVDKPNGGYGSTINAALKVARGKYFRYLDGDDWFDSKSLEKFITLLESAESDAVFNPYYRVYEADGHEELVDDLAGVNEGVVSAEELPDSQNIAACALTYRTSLLRDAHFQMTEHCFYTDIEYAYLPFVGIENVQICKLPLYRYRIGREGQSVSIEGIERHYPDIIRVCTRVLSELTPKMNQLSSYLYGCLTREMASPYYFLTLIPASKERKDALMAFDKSLKAFPVLYKTIRSKNKVVTLLNATHFLAYKPLCIYRNRRA